MEHNLSQREVLDVVTDIGYYILRYGGEISRAEDTVRRIGAAYSMDEVHVFAIATSIIITVEKSGKSLTKTRRIAEPITNLDRVDSYNALSRKICETLPGYDAILEDIKKIESRPTYPDWVMILGCALIGGSFAVFFGGSFCELLTGLIVGALVKIVLLFVDALHAPPFFENVAGAATAVSLIKLATFIFPDLNLFATTIGVLMILVPGVLLTNCIRDFVATDYSAGTAKIIEVLIIASAISLGVGVSLFWR